MSRRNWNRIQPTSLRQALELCKDHAREAFNLSVEGISERMGMTDHWTLYKWLQTGKIPANMIRPYEATCGIDYVTRWLTASAGKLILTIPTGKNSKAQDIHALQDAINAAVGQIIKFYAGNADADTALASIQQAMQGLAWHKVNIEKHKQPELDLTGDTSGD